MEKSTVTSQFVTFQIGDEEYGIDIMLVQEIIRNQKLTKVFNANPAIKGVMNFRGNVIPVIDMRCKFKLPEIEYDDYTVVIIIEVNSKTLGMVVDRVSDIVSFDNEQIQFVDREFVEDVMTDHLKAMAKHDDRIIMLLDSDRVMSFEEYAKVKQAHGNDSLISDDEQIAVIE